VHLRSAKGVGYVWMASRGMTRVYSDMNARWRHPSESEKQRFVGGPQLEGSALEVGQKCLIPETMASSSLSKVE
jgi:hypothetical protein